MAGPDQDLAQEQDGVERPWERPGTVRRDCRPHRGTGLRLLGVASVVFGFLAPCGGVTGFAGLVLGVAAWALAWNELVGLRAGLIDPAGRGPAEDAVSLGRLGALVSLFFLLYYGILLGSTLWR